MNTIRLKLEKLRYILLQPFDTFFHESFKAEDAFEIRTLEADAV